MARRERDYLLYIEDMLVSLQHAVQYAAGMSFEAFCDDLKTRDAVLRCFEVAGEAANNIPKHIKDKYPDCEWNEMYALRIKLAHYYFETDNGIVWEILTHHAPYNIELLISIFEAEKKLTDEGYH